MLVSNLLFNRGRPEHGPIAVLAYLSSGGIMRKLLAICIVTVVATVLTAAPASAVTITDWTSSPITVGDKVFTLISTTWDGAGTVVAYDFGGNLYGLYLDPGSDGVVTNTTETMVYKVEIVDDPGTSQDESLLMYFSQVSGDGDRYIVSGTFTVSGVFDDDSDFSSPLATFSNSATPWGPSSVTTAVGEPKTLYVSVTFTASGGSTILSSYAVTFSQVEDTVPTQRATWGEIKALYE
jgi:hypothetical protein